MRRRGPQKASGAICMLRDAPSHTLDLDGPMGAPNPAPLEWGAKAEYLCAATKTSGRPPGQRDSAHGLYRNIEWTVDRNV